ncbi:PQQ-binding-like beta-propeller repeat protein [Mariniblastus sp.]|nr:PQQ-binding-like beta-propeller repeat protein [Mariniblastus sp.]
MIRKSLLLISFIVLTSGDVHAENWAHWRGPTGNGVALNATPPIEWSDTKNVKWKVEIPGKGSGSPVIWENKVFVVSGISEAAAANVAAAPAQQRSREERPRGDGAQGGQRQRRQRGGRGGRGGGAPPTMTQFNLYCFDRETGKQLWDKTAAQVVPHQGVHGTNNFASASPCTDGQHVYAFFGSRGLFCYTMDGELKWEKHFGKMETRNGFGEGASPTLAGDKIIVPWDHEGQSAVYALNKLTGDIVWETARDEPTEWATPLIVDHDGKQQVILNGQNKARAYDLETGEELWQCGGQTERPCASPVTIDDMVVIGSGHRGSFMGAFKLGGEGDIAGTDKVAWSIDRNTPDIASPILSEDRLYFYKQKTGILSCLDVTTGEPHYSATRIKGIKSTYASPVVAGGYVFLTGRSGTTVVIKDADNLEVVATNSVGEGVDATPAPVDNELFIRGEKHLFCIAK